MPPPSPAGGADRPGRVPGGPYRTPPAHGRSPSLPSQCGIVSRRGGPSHLSLGERLGCVVLACGMPESWARPRGASPSPAVCRAGAQDATRAHDLLSSRQPSFLADGAHTDVVDNPTVGPRLLDQRDADLSPDGTRIRPRPGCRRPGRRWAPGRLGTGHGPPGGPGNRPGRRRWRPGRRRPHQRSGTRHRQPPARHLRALLRGRRHRNVLRHAAGSVQHQRRPRPHAGPIPDDRRPRHPVQPPDCPRRPRRCRSGADPGPRVQRLLRHHRGRHDARRRSDDGVGPNTLRQPCRARRRGAGHHVVLRRRGDALRLPVVLPVPEPRPRARGRGRDLPPPEQDAVHQALHRRPGEPDERVGQQGRLAPRLDRGVGGHPEQRPHRGRAGDVPELGRQDLRGRSRERRHRRDRDPLVPGRGRDGRSSSTCSCSSPTRRPRRRTWR